MIVNTEQDGKSIPATEYDPCITKVDHVVRALRVDGLINIWLAG